MVLSVEVIPLRLHLHIGLQFGISFRVSITQLVVYWNNILKEQCHGTFALILRLHGNEQQIS